jgi:hypothetical protein
MDPLPYRLEHANITRWCVGFRDTPPHDMRWNSTNFTPGTLFSGRQRIRCRSCARIARKTLRFEAGQRLAMQNG